MNPTDATPIFRTALDNGMQVVVIEDHRAPVATHMVWYKNGAADDPLGQSGIAHFLEHLMFKGTKQHQAGFFSEIVSELGGQENAFTGWDYTAYYQRVPKEHLGTMMGFEADRMTGLVLSEDVVDPERNVVLEERRMRTDNDPGAQLQEAMFASLFVHHPYGTPIIGWMHEIEGLKREHAIGYYERFYTPENAVLVVAGDVEPQAVLALAKAHYGAIPARGEAPRRQRPVEPEPRAERRVRVTDEKVEQPSLQRYYVVPSIRTAEPGIAEALEVGSFLLGSNPTGLLYRRLVHERQVAVHAGAWYMAESLDDTRFAIYAIPAAGVSLSELESAVDAVLREFVKTLPDEQALRRAKTRLIADLVYAQDSQATLARVYGAALATGGTIDAVQNWPNGLEAVSAEAIRAAAAQWLTPRRAVTGYLEKPAKAA
jgi:zinc protease